MIEVRFLDYPRTTHRVATTKEPDMADNNVTISGNLTRDPELRFGTTGKAFTKFSIAWNQSKRAGDGWENIAHFFDITCFDKIAEHVAESCSKGTRVTINGEIRQDRWTDKESGDNRSKVVLVANEVAVSLRWDPINGKTSASANEDPFTATQGNLVTPSGADAEDAPF
jgi:single-strand DNA-binding protein